MKKLKISIIIIGYNTRQSLEDLLKSINQIRASEDVLEVIYVDDASSDSSYDFFNKYNLMFIKKSAKFFATQGRAAATQRGIDMSSGVWLFFVQSNVVVMPDIIQAYKKTVCAFDALAFMGTIKYTSKDRLFNQYLNSKKRGFGKCLAGDFISYKYLLFGNCLIHRSVFNTIKLNKKMLSYGGEELDFSYRLNSLFPKMIKASPFSVVLRKNHPGLSEHCLRLFDFGRKNFFLLNEQMKIDVVRFQFLLKFRFFLRTFNSALYLLCTFLNKYDLGFLSLYTIRLQLLSSILKGYYRGS